MRKIIIIAIAILLLILVILAALSMARRPQQQAPKVSPTPTTVPINTGVSDGGSNNADLLNAAKALGPYESDSFKYGYSEEQNRMIVTEKTSLAGAEFKKWIAENGLAELAENTDLVIFVDANGNIIKTLGTAAGYSHGEKQVQNFFDIFRSFSNFGKGLANISPVPTIDIGQNNGNSSSGGNNNSGVLGEGTYFGQCQQYANVPLPDGCNLCKAGCGPTTAAMILSHYLGENYNPERVVSIYEERGYYLGCDGSSYANAKSLFESLGLKTTSYLGYSNATANEVAPDFKKYIDSGWTIFTLANYCDKGCGHFFWITDVDEDNNIYAFDPYYGQGKSPPINENSRYPFPKYRIAFGVKN